jgi:holo-[acyl-carrier protein] synthase
MAERLFSTAEREYALRHRVPAPRLAARFAAKEAVMKALGVGLWKFAFHDVEVVRGDGGEPGLALRGRAAALAAERGAVGWHLSLTHTDSMAMAVAVALG